MAWHAMSASSKVGSWSRQVKGFGYSSISQLERLEGADPAEL